MCGIAGLITWKDRNILKWIKPMTHLIRHRGPDDEGYAFFSLDSTKNPSIFGGNDSPQALFSSPFPYAPKDIFQENPDISDAAIAFGHRRLSIIDLSPSGHQPLCDPTKRYWITYNGEIYNYLEIREELKKLGHSFYTHSDTEVILQAYIEWGMTCLSRFNGMFAFLIYDRNTKTLFGARDRFAVKPLYTWVSPEGFLAIASEIKQFTALPGWSATLNGQLAYDFLNWGITNHLSESLFQGVFSIPGGHYFHCELTEQTPVHILPKQWYHLPINTFHGSLEEAGQTFYTLLKDAVKIRTRADVSIGSCLSGGLDSSTIVCLAHAILQEQNSSHPQMTFSACAHYPEFDEREYIQEITRHTHVKSHFIYPDLKDLMDNLELITWHQDQPFATTSIFAQWEVFKMVKQNGVKVMLDGQGADEQLAGYRGFIGSRMKDLVRNWQFIQLQKELRACQKLQIQSPYKLLLNQILPDWLRQPLRKILHKQILRPSWIQLDKLEAIPRDPHLFTTPAKGALQNLCYTQITRTSLPMLLHFEDRDSMAHSIEARTPFLDYRLVEFIQSLPPEYKLSDGISKRVLRQGLKGTLPEKIRTRLSKLGFATPEEIWMKKHQPQEFQALVRHAVGVSKGILKEGTEKETQAIISGKKPYHSLPWRIISFGKWIERFNVKIL